MNAKGIGLGTTEERRWKGNPHAYSRHARQSFTFEAFVPATIGAVELLLPAHVADTVSAAETEVRDLNREPPQLGDLENLSRQLLRAEAVASSRIEGLEMSHKRLAEAAFAPEDVREIDAQSVLRNIDAMEEAVRLGSRPGPVTVENILKLHSILMSHESDERFGPGELRTKQNWIGSGDTPRDADFVPPPEEYVPALMEDLTIFMNRNDMPTVVQAAVTHAQFETIHPFADGNGRVGRCLIHVLLRKRALAPRYVPPISLVLAANAAQYVDGLTMYRDGRVDEWCELFAGATHAAAKNARRFASRVGELQEEWRTKAGNPRTDSAAIAIIAGLPAQPVIDIKTAAQIANASDEAARRALHALEGAGVLKRYKAPRGRGAWEAVGLFELLNDFERDLADTGDGSKPTRRSPYSPVVGGTSKPV